MNIKYKKYVILFLSAAAFILFISYKNSFAASDIGGIQKGVSAAAAGLFGAYSTFNDNSGAMYYNPACLYGLKKVEIMASSSKSGFDQKFDALSYTFLNGVKKRAYGGISYIKDEIGSIEGRDNSGNYTGMFSDKSEMFGYAVGNSNRYLDGIGVSYGVMAKYITRKIYNVTARGYGLDLGILKSDKFGGRFSIAVKNAIGSLKWHGTKTDPNESLSKIYSAGYSFGCLKDARVSAEISRESGGNKNETAVGFEKHLSESAIGRIGFSGGDLSYGLGFNLNQSRVDYAFSRNEFDDIHKITAIFYLDDERISPANKKR